MRPALLQLRATLFALLGITAVTFICFRVVHANGTTEALALSMVLLVAGSRTNLWGTVAASVVAALCLDWFFIPPVGRITIEDSQGWVALAVFLTVTFLASRLSTRLRQQRDELAARQSEIERLYALSRSMLLASGTEDVRRLIVNKCVEIFGFAEMALFESATGRFHRSDVLSSISDEKLRQVARHGAVEYKAGEGVTIIPVTLGNKVFGSIGMRGMALPEAGLQSLANTIAVGLAQAQAQEAGSRAEAVRRSEELKSVMIDALAHDLKTPLTAIEAAAQMLREPALVSSAQRNDLLEVIQEETNGLRQKLAEALHLARIDAKRLKLEARPVAIRDLIERAVHSFGERMNSHAISLDVAPDLPPVFADGELIVQALKQLVDNAAKYSAARSPISISACRSGEAISISVRDYGEGLTELEQGRVFDKFYRGRYDRSAVQGTGMGLSIAKEILEAHGGTIRVESLVGEGSIFTIALRIASAPARLEGQPA